ncbi:Glycoside hydrolase, superfamily domain-containing protein [Rozella allomycis CSF55]|uniref:Glycoside hydrolase, superfamily domain-containing protein n=1 Tax=Rozella allomycis (strain CSF55) TaxID=988480 RepID=A0A075ART5_ROZAC|nr:Glycoside hydrolase, superfamily domain-containing protein [Rozella allomycis CSF55]|eukprot:EPZ32890.1 Glycoside hydrolase, superfamily domain-containing protein [Rozella allomycis CSF55]
MDLSIHCSSPYPGFTKPASGYTLLKCPDIENDIKQCQSLGKKIIISVVNLGSTTSMKNEQDGENVANMIWNSFLGGSGNRPFGSAILDGVDLWNRDNQKIGYLSLVNKLRALMNADSSRKYLLTASARCSYPEPTFGPQVAGLPFTEVPKSFDYISFHAMSTPECTFQNKDLFYQTFEKWSDWAHPLGIPIYVGLPASISNGAPGDYITVGNLGSALSRLSNLTSFSGITLWEFSADYQNLPCSNTKELSYGQIIYQMMSEKKYTITCTEVETTNTRSKPRSTTNSGNGIPSSALETSRFSYSISELAFSFFIVAFLK